MDTLTGPFERREDFPMGFSVEPEQATTPFVVALDIGSSGTRGAVYDAAGVPLSGHRHKVEHSFTTTGDGTSVVDADQLVDEIAAVLDAVLHDKLTDRIAAVAIDTFSMSLIGVDADLRAVTPCYTYADSRAAGEVARLRAELDEAEVQQRTGARLHTSYLAPRLRWLRSTEPGLWGKVRRWVSLTEYVHLRLIGAATAGTSVAAWTGMLDRRTGDWDPMLLEAAGIDPESLSAVADHHTPIVAAHDVTKRWPALRGTAWLPGLSDGISSNVGAGGTGPAAVVVSAATSGAVRVLLDGIPPELPSGLWCYRIDARRSLLGGALNDVGRAFGWLNDTLRLPEDGDLDATLTAEPSTTTPMVLPFLTGERATGWAGSARAVFTGVSAGHGPSDLARGMVEGIALSYGRVFEQLIGLSGAPERVLCNGRIGTAIPGLLTVLADVLQQPISPVTLKRATLHGTALLALEHAAPDVERLDVTVGDAATPHAERAAHYRDRATEFARVYDGVIA